MRKKNLQNKWLLYSFLAILIWLPYNNFAQSLKRQCISSYGSAVVTDNISYEQSAGQTYSTTNSFENNTAILQGFIQPNTFKIKEISSNLLKNINFSVYPNPASYSITIKSEEAIEQINISVFDVNGSQILSERVQNLLEYCINCESWVNGVYIITIYDKEKNSKTLKLIISK